MKLRKNIVGGVVLATIFLIFLVGTANAGCVGDDTGTVYGCGDTLTESCTFNESMTCSSGAGLIIGANNITINGAGFKITGNREDLSCGWCAESVPAEHSGIVNTEYDNVVIKNLEIENFCTGIALGQYPPDVDNNTVIGCKIYNCGNSTATTHGIHLIGVNNCTITKNEIYNIEGEGIEAGCGGGGNGISMYGVNEPRGNYNTIIYNNLSYNNKSGFFMKMMCMHNTISDNTAIGNPEGGFVLMCMKSNYNTIECNNVSENTYGIIIGGRNNMIRNNIANNNNYFGINLPRSDGSYNNELYENTVCGNGVADIRTCGPECYGNYGDNNTCNTTSYYDDEETQGCTYTCGAGVIADFSAEPTKGTSPLEVKFIDRSKPEGEITSWLWDFGDGNTSDEQNPTHTYSTLYPYSYYNVSLTVTGSVGADTVTKSDYIKVWKEDAAPNADFHCPPGVGMTSEPVVFTDKSIGEVTSWLWDFGDGNTNTTQNPVHYYSTGIYTVSLEVTGPGGSSKDTKFKCVRVGEEGAAKRPLNDAAFFAVARNGTAPFTFTDMSRSEGEIDSRKWNFGDENTSNERNPTHTYNSAGIYNVSLEVTNIGGAKARETKIGYIVVGLFTEYFDTGAPANPYPSIFGTHKGKIIPDRDITVNKMYTYPCSGTGGHTEYVKIWNESEGIEGIGNWSGYQGDYHNITISPAITLRKGHEYNYMIITGSYPQIVHARGHKAKEGGNITCTEFIDANNKRYDDWIPAIRLWKDA